MSNKRNNYLNWDTYFMALAKLSSLRSKDPSTQVGACIVNKDNKVLSTGYNGTPNGFNDDNFPWNRDGKTNKYPYVCHAELNAIINYVGSSNALNNSIMYVTLFPCNECAKAIIQSGIKEIIYLENKYKDADNNIQAKEMFETCGITYRKLDITDQMDINISLK